MYPIKVRKMIKKSRWVLAGWLLVAGLMVYSTPWRAEAQCTSVTAVTLIASPDDVGNFWFNGVFLGSFAYTSKGTGSQPQTYVFTAAQWALVNISGNNCLAAQNVNTVCCEMSLSYVLDITCSTGKHAYITSDSYSSPPMTGYYDATGCCAPANDGSGNPWYSPSWTGSFPSTFAPTCENEFFWAKRMFDPVTGQLACALAPSANENPPAYTPPNDAYYRQCMPLTFYSPPPVPTLTITKSALGPVSQINSGMPVTYQAVICNNGGAVSSPVTVLDNKPPGFSYDGPYNPAPPQGPYGDPFIFSEGLPGAPIGGGSACTTLTYELIDYSVNSSQWCQVATNSVTVSSYGTSSSAQVTIYCPPLTNTYTPTFTYTPTPTWTPGPPTNTYTPTSTYTATGSYTPTPTWTITYTPVPPPPCTKLYRGQVPNVVYWAPLDQTQAGPRLKLCSSEYSCTTTLSHGCSMSWNARTCSLSFSTSNCFAGGGEGPACSVEARLREWDKAVIYRGRINARHA